MTTRAEAVAILQKHGVSRAFVDVLTAEDPEAAAAALASAIQHQGRDEATGPEPSYFLPPVRWSDGASGRRIPVGVDVTVGGRTYTGGRLHGPLTDRRIAELEAAGFEGRLYRGELGTEQASRWEQSLEILPPADPIAEARAVAFGP
jgi:hypothetical protein